MEGRKPFTRRGLWIAVGIAASALGLGALERWGAIGSRSPSYGDSAQARWIWLDGDWRRPRPLAFLAAADFTLERLPDAASLIVVGDEEYVASLNGWVVGSGRYHQGAPGGRHSLDGLLRVGGNRAVVELRSVHGAGGLLSWIELTGQAEDPSRARRLLPTGPEWRLFRTVGPGVLEGWRPLGEGEAPMVWGAPPIGRWRDVSIPARPTPALMGPASARPIAAARGRSLRPSSEWQAAWAERSFSPLLWSAILLEWPKEIEGFLEIQFLGGDGGDAMLFFAAAGGPPNTRLPADALVVRAPGQTVWRDAVARRFQSVLIAAKGRPIAAAVWEAKADPAADLPGPRAGVLGIQPPPLRSPVEDKLRREFEGFASLAGREGG